MWPRLRRVPAEAGGASVGGAVLEVGEVGRQLADAAHGLVSPLPGVGEPEGLRRLCEAGSDHDVLRFAAVSGRLPATPRRDNEEIRAMLTASSRVNLDGAQIARSAPVYA